MAGLLGVLVALIALLATAGGPAFAARESTGNGSNKARGVGNSLYIVQLIEPPVVAYDGGVAGIPATRPARGSKINPNSQNVREYVRFLEGRHDAKARVVGANKVYSYRYSFNGFAAELSADQVALLSAQPDVLAVTKDSIAQLDTSSTPAFLGLSAPGGIWSALSGNANGNPITARGPNSGGAGEGVVVGIIDSGIWPENPSFSDRDASGRLAFQQLPGWHGRCVPGEAFTAANCNQKLIAAQWFGEGFGGAAGIKASFPYEYLSARDADGHGSHTASTAASNYGVTAVVDGLNLGQISGMAPRARIAVYKTCWGNGGEGGCPNSDNVAAIDQAVADGVDVINYSISGTRTNFRDPVEIAFLFAADAGVFVAASAGNTAGPSTVAHPSPWITTVAASTHDRVYAATASLGNSSSYNGVGLGAAVPSAPLVYAGNVALASANVTEAQLCYPGTLNPNQVAGKIVVCDRDVIARTDKSRAVQMAGGVGMILVNRSVNSVNADLHFVPTVHLDAPVRTAIIAYASAADATASLSAGAQIAGALAPTMAALSSRGPLLTGDGNLLKPDITAPGVDVLAAVSPIGYNGRSYDFLSGTSMSSPHIAGIAALMKDLYPSWSPAAIKSALMTTAAQTTNQGTPIAGGAFAYGAGHVAPNPAMNPGLVFDAGFVDYLGFLCGTQLPASSCTSSGVPVLSPSNLNVPSIAIGALAGAQTVIRTATNVSGQSATFSAVASGLTGMSVSISPASFTLAPGQSQQIRISFSNTSAALNAYASGAITWTSDKGHSARIPAVVRPVALGVPAALSSDGSPTSYNVAFGYSGAFSATPRGLVAPAITADTVAQDPDQTFNPADPAGTVAIPVVIPAGSTYARFALFDADVAPGADMDLYVYQGATLVGSSTSGTSAEEVNFSFGGPTGAPIALMVYVHGWGLPTGSSPFQLHSWYIPASAAGNMTVSAPANATAGTTGTVDLSFSGLLPSTRYLGSITYSGAAGMPAPTIISVNTP